MLKRSKRTPYLETGQRFCRLVILERIEDVIDKNGWKRDNYKCVCDCGKTTTATSNQLKRGLQSCGCAKDDSIRNRSLTHGMRETREYNIWCHMLARCSTPSNPSYENYGGRGITVDERWSDFESFYLDMGKCPPDFSLDRVDTNGNYCKDNCRWADDFEQAANRRKKKTNKSGRTGVCFHKQSQLWQSELTVKGKTFYGGRFQTFEEAVLSRINLELRHLGAVRSDDYENRSDLIDKVENENN